MPLVVDIDDAVASTSTNPAELSSRKKSVLQTKGGRLEEMFMSSAHAKFYTAINTVLVAPCLVGKSNMFRRSHLNALTNGEGIDYFSNNICEDHLIGDLLWKQPVPKSVLEASVSKRKWGNHAMLFGDIVIQPMANMRVSEYVARRVRWLRVRKYTVPAATGVEPTTESFLCSLMLSYGLTSLPYAHEKYAVPQTWSALALFWVLFVASWAAVDWTLYKKIHSAVSVAQDEHTPSFARPAQNSGARRPLKEWLMAWLGREALAFPIWFWAIFGGATVNWRGKSFWVGMDMRVHAIEEKGENVGNGVLDRRKAE
jgi:ceramide glucosyltransferase